MFDVVVIGFIKDGGSVLGFKLFGLVLGRFALKGCVKRSNCFEVRGRATALLKKPFLRHVVPLLIYHFSEFRFF